MARKKEKLEKADGAIDRDWLVMLRNYARGRLRLGFIHLNEAKLLNARDDVPNARAHAAYYAMHHCAAAALYLENKVGKSGLVVESHEHVLAQYSLLVENEEPPLSTTAIWLNRARSIRVKADYGMVHGGATIADAKEICSNAVDFFEIFQKKWRIDMP